ncbi:hypothetical protein GCM10023081_07420 [Arthrobacter ginkgonis]|uniref:Uncharacterized protein n=1 Tax=Arthrobacter ginkgonis TaxID=1630594 RepID=A0ABP7BYN2_9MICC
MYTEPGGEGDRALYLVAMLAALGDGVRTGAVGHAEVRVNVESTAATWCGAGGVGDR